MDNTTIHGHPARFMVKTAIGGEECANYQNDTKKLSGRLIMVLGQK